jgi:C-terminal processing protease CtpA/Prc
MTRTTYSFAAGLSLVLATAIGLQAAAQEKKDSPPPSNDSQQQNSNNLPGATNTPSQTDQQNAPPQSSQNNDSERANTNQNQSPSNANNAPASEQSQSNTTDSRAPRESSADQRDNQDKTQSVLKSQNRDSQTNQDSRDYDRSRSTSSDRRDGQRDSNRDFRRDFKFGQSTNRGLTVSTLGRNSIFYRSGLRDGDIIISYGGRPIRSQDDFFRLAVYQPGQRIPVVVWRDGREETIYVVYEQDNGVALGPAGNQNVFGAEFDPRSNDGALIVRVQPGSPAQKAGLMANDFVVVLNGDRVSSSRDAIEIVQSLAPGQRVQVEYDRHARVEVVLGGSRSDRNVDSASYQTTDRPASVAVGVDTDSTRRVDSNRDRNDNNDRDRQDNRREGRGILPRFRN